jgi:hypothetical protein
MIEGGPPSPLIPFHILRVIDILRTVMNDNIEEKNGNEPTFLSFILKSFFL